MFSTIQSPSRSFTWMTFSLLPSPMSTNGSSSAPMWTAVGTSLVIVMPPTVVPRTLGRRGRMQDAGEFLRALPVAQVERRHDEEVLERGRDQAAQDDDRHRVLDL